MTLCLENVLCWSWCNHFCRCFRAEDLTRLSSIFSLNAVIASISPWSEAIAANRLIWTTSLPPMINCPQYWTVLRWLKRLNPIEKNSGIKNDKENGNARNLESIAMRLVKIIQYCFAHAYNLGIFDFDWQWRGKHLLCLNLTCFWVVSNQRKRFIKSERALLVPSHNVWSMEYPLHSEMSQDSFEHFLKPHKIAKNTASPSLLTHSEAAPFSMSSPFPKNLWWV